MLRVAISATAAERLALYFDCGPMIGYLVEIFVDRRSVWLGALDGKSCAVSKRIAAKIFKTRDEALAAVQAYLKTPDASGSSFKIHEALRSALG